MSRQILVASLAANQKAQILQLPTGATLLGLGVLQGRLLLTYSGDLQNNLEPRAFAVLLAGDTEPSAGEFVGSVTLAGVDSPLLVWAL